jgi:16S rRNA G527 N7-methylase RsmG
MTTRDISPGEHFNRDNPSKKYTSLLEEYKAMHNLSERMFNGRSLLKFVDIIGAYLEKNECASVLDYGSGKGASS